MLKLLRKLFIENQSAASVFFILLFFVVLHNGLRESTNLQGNLNSDRWSKDYSYDFSSTTHPSTNLIPILNEEDKKLYKAIFTLQRSENWKGADKRIAKIKNKILLGHVQAQRLLHSYYKPTKIELKNWIAKFSDHPEAYKIYKLVGKSDPTFISLSKAMKKDYLFGHGDGSGLSRSVEHSLVRRYWGNRNDAYAMWKKIHYHIRRGRITYAYNKLISEQYQNTLKPLEVDMAKWSIAEGYFAFNKDEQAISIVEDALKRSGKKIPKANWIAGISAWRLGQWEKSAEFFSKLAESDSLSDWERATGGFWASRAYKKIGDNANARIMLGYANKYPRTFYGMLATAALGKKLLLEWKNYDLSRDELDNLMKIKNVRRSLALIEIGQTEIAEKELRKIYPKSSLPVKKHILSLAGMLNIPGLEIRMASMISGKKNGYFDRSLYPIPPWKPEDGFTIDPALLFAFIRHESGFNPLAKSHAGAKGLMQLMPKTASYIARRNKYKISGSTLYAPEKNITLGQDYLEYLLTQRKIKGNLFFMAAAYNAGPNALNRWKKKVKYKDDPLLFIESIPSKETRDFIQRIMSNYWIYREKLGYKNGSLQSILNGGWPLYKTNDSHDDAPYKVALLPLNEKDARSFSGE